MEFGAIYDTCTESNYILCLAFPFNTNIASFQVNFWQENKLYFLFFVITLLIMLVILLIAFQITLWYRKKRRSSWGKNIIVPDLFSKPTVTLDGFYSSTYFYYLFSFFFTNLFIL